MNRIRSHVTYPEKKTDPFASLEAAVLANISTPIIAERFGLTIAAAAARVWRLKRMPTTAKVSAAIESGVDSATICDLFGLTPRQVEGRKYRMKK